MEVDAIEPGVKHNDLADGQLGLEAGGLKLNAHGGAGVQGLAANVVAGDPDGAGGWPEQAFGGAQCAGLAGSVGAEQAEDLTGPDFKGDVPDGLKVAVENIQVFDLEDGLVG